MSPKPTRDAVEEMLNDFEAHELIGSRRDVYELVVSVLKNWLAQEEELEKERNFVEAHRLLVRDLKAENRALKEELKSQTGKVSRFSVVVPSELDAGIRGYTEEVHVILKSGEAIGDNGEFEEFIQPILEEWFDGGKVTIIKEPQP